MTGDEDQSPKALPTLDLSLDVGMNLIDAKPRTPAWCTLWSAAELGMKKVISSSSNEKPSCET